VQFKCLTFHLNVESTLAAAQISVGSSAR